MTYKEFRRKARSLLSAGRRPENVAEVWRRQRAELERSMTLVRIFYVVVMFMLVHDTMGWHTWAEVDALHLIWPVWWIDYVGVQTGIQIVLGFAMISAILASLLPEFRIVRILVVIGLLLQSALNNSLAGAIVAHGHHAYIWCAFWFIFLPSGTPARVAASRGRRLRYTQMFWSAQATIMLFYSLGGMFKIVGGVWQASQGLSHSFSVDALSRHTANRILEGGQLSPYYSMGELVVEYHWLGFMLFVPVIFLEALSFLVAFRPAVHRIWAVGLIGMHLGIFFAMSILFSAQGMILGLLFLCSPFSPDKIVWRDVLYQIPVIGDVLGWMERRSEASPVEAEASASA